MLADVDLAAVAELMTGHRASILLALVGGDPLSAGELARRAGISPSLASAHLGKLLDGGLIAAEQLGRRREYRLADRRVAEAIEGMLTIAPARRAVGLTQSNRGHAIRQARTCYDHLAGRLGVAITDGLERQGAIRLRDNSFELTAAGESRLSEFGLDIAALRRQRRAFARPCLDWTERRPHLAGALGAALADRFREAGWVTPHPSTRALLLTDIGERGARERFGVNLAAGG